MDQEKVIDVPMTGPAVSRIPVLSHSCAASGLRLTALAPGSIEIRMTSDVYLVDVNMGFVDNVWSVNSDRLVHRSVEPATVAWMPPGTEFRLQVENETWGLLLEIEPDRAAQIEAEALDGRALPGEFSDYSPDVLSAVFGRHLIDHLRQFEIDPLFVEGLGLTIASRAIAVAEGSATSTSKIGILDKRISRALDYIEVHHGSHLSVAELAGVAAMSPGHFARSFKRATGHPVWAYVQERRIGSAKNLLETSGISIAEIAHRCGFSGQSQFTKSFRHSLGMTPAAYRKSVRH